MPPPHTPSQSPPLTHYRAVHMEKSKVFTLIKSHQGEWVIPEEDKDSVVREPATRLLKERRDGSFPRGPGKGTRLGNPLLYYF